jgi:hypothetical protein
MRCNRLNRRTWNAAIRRVQKHLIEFPSHVPVTDAQERILNAVFALCEQLMGRHQLLPVPTDKHLAAKYAVCPRTVRNWRKAGCPFAEGQRRVLDWLAKRRYAPAGAQARFSAQLFNRRHPPKDILRTMWAETRADVLNLRARYLSAGIPMPEWVRRMPFRAR